MFEMEGSENWEGKRREKRIYAESKMQMRRLVRREKHRVNNKFGKELRKDFKFRRNTFWKKLKRDKEGDENMFGGGVKDVVGNVIPDPKLKRERCKNYYEQLLNEVDDRVAQVARVEFEGEREERVLCDSVIKKEEVVEALKQTKGGKAAGVDNVTPEMLKEGGEEMVEWLSKLCNKAFEEGSVPEDWKSAIIVPIYKGKRS